MNLHAYISYNIEYAPLRGHLDSTCMQLYVNR